MPHPFYDMYKYETLSTADLAYYQPKHFFMCFGMDYAENIVVKSSTFHWQETIFTFIINYSEW